MLFSRTFLLWFCVLFFFASAASGQVDTDEVVSRRAELASHHSDGLIILAARWEEKKMEQPGWIQDPSFFYFTNLAESPGAILVIDVPAGRSLLFASKAPRSFGMAIESLDLASRPDLIEHAGIDALLSHDHFLSYVRSRMAEGITKIYLDEPRRMPPSGVPDGMLAVTNFHRLWHQSLQAALPEAEFLSAATTITRMRWTKSDEEVKILRRNAEFTAAALAKGIRAIEAGLLQRQAEAAVITGCIEAGAQGPSFWPWVMGGPNAHTGELVRSFYDYENLNRAYQDGELVRVDVGCMSGGYGGDVGRTVPVSGTFSEDQARTWNLLIAGYLAGLDAMKAGVKLDDVREASREAISRLGQQSEELRELAESMADASGVNWHIHGVGIDSGESPGEEVFRAGSVIAYEPGFVWGEDAFYLEDMILITEDGMEVLSAGLPYSSEEIAAFMSIEE